MKSSEVEKDESATTKSKIGTVDAVHDQLDALVLSVFEAIRGHEVAVKNAEKEEAVAGQIKPALQRAHRDVAKEVRVQYNATMARIDELVGVERTKAQQEELLERQDQEIVQLRDRVVQAEKNLLSKRNAIDKQLQTLLSDDVLGLR